MNHRERVLSALHHREPDRLPIDFGGHCDSTMMAVSYQKLRRELGLSPSITRVLDVVGQTAVIEDDVRDTLGVDTLPVTDQPKAWRKCTLTDGSPGECPARFQPQLLDDGSQVVFDGEGNITLRMPQGGFYFDPVYAPLADATGVQDIERQMDAIVNYDTPSHLDQTYEEVAEGAKALRERSDRALVGFFGGHLLQAGQVLRGWERFLEDLQANPTFAHAFLERATEAHLARLARYTATVGQVVDVILFEEDLGTQDRPLMRPAVYRKMLKPYMARLFAFAKSRCDAILMLHTDGAVAPLIPDFIEMGVEALNPVQVSAAGMDAATLKREFGRDLAFWGAGCDPQNVLPFAKPQQVMDEVRRRIDALAAGGGYVFAPVHNVQGEVPAENIAAMFRAAREHGAYGR